MEPLDIDSFKTRIGNNVKTMRRKKGYSVRKFALLADMEHHQILALEKGATDIRLSTLLKLSNALEVYPTALMANLEDVS